MSKGTKYPRLEGVDSTGTEGYDGHLFIENIGISQDIDRIPSCDFFEFVLFEGKVGQAG